MIEVIGIKVKDEMIQYFDPQELDLNKGDLCVVEIEEGVSELGEVLTEIKIISPQEIKGRLRKVVRKLGKEDLEQLKLNKSKEKEAFMVCLKKIEEMELQMKLVKVEYNFDRSKAIFFFCADNRIDFRDLVKDLAHELKTRIEMRQIGVRDEAKMIGSFGHCGRPLCCATFLKEFSPVSMQMVKVQNLASNPAKLSGACSRLMCCLKYEYNFYKENVKKFPRIGSKIKVNEEMGTVIEANIVKGAYKVKFDDGRETEVQVY